MGRINISIDNDRKEELQAYVEANPRFESVSQFLRFLVIEELRDTDDQDDLTSPVRDELNTVDNKLTEIKNQLTDLSRQVGDDTAATQTLAQEIYQTLPKAPVASTAEIAASGESAEFLNDQHQVTATETDAPTTAAELAQHLDADKEEVKEAIQLLKANFMPIVDFVDANGEKHYLKQGERR